MKETSYSYSSTLLVKETSSLISTRHNLESAVKSLGEVPEWGAMAAGARGSTVFHEPWFLEELGASRLLCICRPGASRPLACLPLFESQPGVMEQSSLSSPYAGPVFEPIAGPDEHRLPIERHLMDAMARSLKSQYQRVSFSLSPQIIDIVAFLRLGFIPEVRFTYVVDVACDIDNCISRMSKRRRVDLQRAGRCDLRVIPDLSLAFFDVARAIKWAPAGDYEVKTRSVLRQAIARDRGRAFVALQSERPVAGLFMVWDRRCSYTTHSYFLEDAARTGASTLLYLTAMSYTRECLRLPAVDLEGSVLPGVEEYYQSFGGRQTVYFRLHWRSDRTSLNTTDLYEYS